MAKYRRQPKAGDLAHKTSAPFAIRPREFVADNFAPAMRPARLASEHEPTIIPAGFKIKTLPARAAYSADTWRIKGGMSGGATGCCRGVTSNNGMGVVPQAFIK